MPESAPRPRLASMRSRVVALVASWVLVSIGVPLIVTAEVGVAPFDVLNTAIADRTGWSFGVVFVVASLVFYAIGTALGAPPGWGSLGGTLVIGPMIDAVFAVLPEPSALAVRIPLLLVGILVLSMAISLAVATELGTGPTEVVMLGLVRHGMGVVSARRVSDGLPLVIGALLGGDVGVGTVVFLVAMGPLVKRGLHVLRYVPPGRRPVDPIEW